MEEGGSEEDWGSISKGSVLTVLKYVQAALWKVSVIKSRFKPLNNYCVFLETGEYGVPSKVEKILKGSLH